MSVTKNIPESTQTEACSLARRIQSTIISNTLTRARWEQHIADCRKYHFQAAMIPPAWVKDTVQALRASGIRTASFVDFPYGTMTSTGKAYETARLVEAGVAYLKNASGVGAVGIATPEQITFLRRIAPPHVGVKASG